MNKDGEIKPMFQNISQNSNNWTLIQGKLKFVVSEKCVSFSLNSRINKRSSNACMIIILHYRLQSNLLMKGIHQVSESEVCSIIFFLGKICVVCDTEKWFFFFKKTANTSTFLFVFYPKIKTWDVVGIQKNRVCA